MVKRIFIAEDEPHIVESLCFILKRSGFDVAFVNDGAKVVENIRNYVPDVIVLDVMLPHCNGFEILKSLKSDDKLGSIPILMLTAKGQQQDRTTAEQLRVDAFITKPFSNREVLDCIKKLLAKRQAPSQ